MRLALQNDNTIMNSTSDFHGITLQRFAFQLIRPAQEGQQMGPRLRAAVEIVSKRSGSCYTAIASMGPRSRSANSTFTGEGC